MRESRASGPWQLFSTFSAAASGREVPGSWVGGEVPVSVGGRLGAWELVRQAAWGGAVVPAPPLWGGGCCCQLHFTVTWAGAKVPSRQPGLVSVTRSLGRVAQGKGGLILLQLGSCRKVVGWGGKWLIAFIRPTG